MVVGLCAPAEQEDVARALMDPIEAFEFGVTPDARMMVAVCRSGRVTNDQITKAVDEFDIDELWKVIAAMEG